MTTDLAMWPNNVVRWWRRLFRQNISLDPYPTLRLMVQQQTRMAGTTFYRLLLSFCHYRGLHQCIDFDRI
jgi:hypothetical protein